MRIDKRLQALTVLTDPQRYFLSCWFNLVHEYSLDSFRVRVMNPANVLREIQRALSFTDAKPEDKAMVLEEAHQLLSADSVLKADVFDPIVGRLLSLLSGDKMKLVSAKGPSERLLQYTVAELRPVLDEHYLEVAFSRLEKSLLPPEESGATSDLAVLHSMTAGLLSTLLDKGFSLESLFKIYTEVLVPRKTKGDYHFSRKIGLTRTLLTQPKQAFDVVFALDQISRPQEIPVTLGTLTISETPPFSLYRHHAKTGYLTPLARRLFVTIENVVAVDRRAAGLQANDQLGNVINLLRFEYEQAKLQVPDQFAVVDHRARADGGRVYPLPRLVPNPTLLLNGHDLASFVASVNELIAGPHFSDEGRDRITSAFRLYRQGRDQDSIETKLVHWWTALEYLVRGNQAGSGIGKSVEGSLAPVIGLGYVPKLLLAVRNLLVDKGISLAMPDGTNLDLRPLSLPELWDLLRTKTQREAIQTALESDPFVQIQVNKFLDEIATPGTLNQCLRNHEQRVRWQVQRLWRTRCDIVHSAGRGGNHLLLCSNLEYYLKTALHGLLAALRHVPTLSGPHEYFDRETYRYENLLSELAAGRDGAVRGYLNA